MQNQSEAAGAYFFSQAATDRARLAKKRARKVFNQQETLININKKLSSKYQFDNDQLFITSMGGVVARPPGAEKSIGERLFQLHARQSVISVTAPSALNMHYHQMHPPHSNSQQHNNILSMMSSSSSRPIDFADTRLQAIKYLTEDMIKQLDDMLVAFDKLPEKPILPAKVIYEWHSDWYDLIDNHASYFNMLYQIHQPAAAHHHNHNHNHHPHHYHPTNPYISSHQAQSPTKHSPSHSHSNASTLANYYPLWQTKSAYVEQIKQLQARANAAAGGQGANGGEGAAGAGGGAAGGKLNSQMSRGAGSTLTGRMKKKAAATAKHKSSFSQSHHLTAPSGGGGGGPAGGGAGSDKEVDGVAGSGPAGSMTSAGDDDASAMQMMDDLNGTSGSVAGAVAAAKSVRINIQQPSHGNNREARTSHHAGNRVNRERQLTNRNERCLPLLTVVVVVV